MNKVLLMGRLTREPEVRYTASEEKQMAVARFALAVPRRGSRPDPETNRQSADFINCVAFGRQAEVAEQYLHKGTKIAVEGRIQTGSYTNREGLRIYTTDIIVESIEFAENKGRENSQPVKPGTEDASADRFMVMDGTEDDRLPFE